MKRFILSLIFLSTINSIADTMPTVATTDSGHVMHSKKDMKWTPAPASLPPGAQATVLDGDPTKAGEFTMRIKLPPNYKIPPHTHPADEHITVIEGAFSMGLGEKFDANIAHQLKTGDYARMTAGTKHFAMTKSAAIVQLHGVGPWGITYVNPADDPRASSKKIK